MKMEAAGSSKTQAKFLPVHIRKDGILQKLYGCIYKEATGRTHNGKVKSVCQSTHISYCNPMNGWIKSCISSWQCKVQVHTVLLYSLLYALGPKTCFPKFCGNVDGDLMNIKSDPGWVGFPKWQVDVSSSFGGPFTWSSKSTTSPEPQLPEHMKE